MLLKVCNSIFSVFISLIIQFVMTFKPFFFLPSGLPQTKLGNYLETRLNDFLKRQNHPESGEVTIRVVHVSDKVVEVKPGMKSR